MTKRISAAEEAMVHAAFKSGRITIASQDEVNEYEQEIDAILRVLGHPEAFVTDESLFSDFNAASAKPWRRKMVQAFNVPMPPREMLLIDMAKQIRSVNGRAE